MTGKREVCYLIGPGEEILWRDASESPLCLPDSRARWEAIWAERERLTVIVHSHPCGPLAFSSEDESTMSALQAALGRAPAFGVLAPRGVLLRDLDGVERVLRGVEEPSWAAALRRESGMEPAVDEQGAAREAAVINEEE